MMTDRETPRAELHVHLEGTVQPETLLQIARRNDQHLPATTVEEIRALYAFTDFDHFLDVWNLTTNCLQTAQDYSDITAAYARQAAAQGVRYIEAIFSPAERVLRGASFETLFDGYCDGVLRALAEHDVVMRLTPDLFWSVTPDLAEETARCAVRYRDRGIVGLGIGGGEHFSGPEPYIRAFAIAREGGLAAVPHTGETTGPDRIRAVMDAFLPRRIRHGIGVVGDPGLMGDIVARGIGLDVCPTSNVRTGVVASVEDVPLEALHAAGIRVTIGSDDPAMFAADIDTEHRIANAAGISDRQLWANTLATCAAEPTLLAEMSRW